MPAQVKQELTCLSLSKDAIDVYVLNFSTKYHILLVKFYGYVFFANYSCKVSN